MLVEDGPAAPSKPLCTKCGAGESLLKIVSSNIQPAPTPGNLPINYKTKAIQHHMEKYRPVRCNKQVTCVLASVLGWFAVMQYPVKDTSPSGISVSIIQACLSRCSRQKGWGCCTLPPGMQSLGGIALRSFNPHAQVQEWKEVLFRTRTSGNSDPSFCGPPC